MVMVLHSYLSWVTYMSMPLLEYCFSTEHSVLFSSLHLMDSYKFYELSTAVDRLALNDTGLEMH